MRERNRGTNVSECIKEKANVTEARTSVSALVISLHDITYFVHKMYN